MPPQAKVARKILVQATQPLVCLLYTSDIKGKKITVAGGGGAATAIQVQCALDGAREITIYNTFRN